MRFRQKAERGNPSVNGPMVVLVMVLIAVGPGLAQEQAPDQDSPAVPQINWNQRLDHSVGRAVHQLLASTSSNDLFIRSNAMEACENLDPLRAMPILQIGIDDPAVPVRFAALTTIGKMRMRELLPAARRQFKDTSPHVRAAVIFVLRRCGEPIDPTPLASMLTSRDASLRGSVAMLLGMMGDSSAVPMLKNLAQVPLPRTDNPVSGVLVRIQTAEARVRLGDDSVVNVIRGGLYSNHDEVRVLAAMMLGRIRDFRMEEAFFELMDNEIDPIELRLAAADALARMSRTVEVVKEVLENADLVLTAGQSESPLVRSQTAHTLASIESARRQSERYLATLDEIPPRYVGELFLQDRLSQAIVTLLGDASEKVRLSASAAVFSVVPSQEPDLSVQ